MKTLQEMNTIYSKFGQSATEVNWAISKSCYLFIKEVLEEGKTILELGSGVGTEILSDTYNLISIEEDSTFIGRHPSNYIYAPLKKLEDDLLEKYKPSTSWYDPEIINNELNGEKPLKYDLILVDGPAYAGGRGGFYENLNLFDTTKIIVFDDIERIEDKKIFDMVVKKLGRPTKILHDMGSTLTGVILTEELKHLKD